MELFRFELKKVIKQRKILWLILIVILVGSGVFIQNDNKKSLRSDRAADSITPYFSEISDMRNSLSILSREGTLDDAQVQQLEALGDVTSALSIWKVAINNEKWAETPIYEMEFWEGIHIYENYGGQFSTIQGTDREKAIQKNKWMVEHQLSYDDELYPLSPGLVLNQILDWLYSIWGILILLLFFGTTISTEKEQNTWLFLRTQPRTKWKLYLSKFMIINMIVVLYMFTVFLVGLCIPLLFSDYGINLSYPQIVRFADHFTIISTLELFIRKTILFFATSFFAFSLVFLFSNWLKDSFSSLLLTTLTFVVSYTFTSSSTVLQKIWNPVNSIYSIPFVQEMPIKEVMYTSLSSVIWSVMFILLSFYLPEKNIEMFQGKTIIKPFAGGKVSKSQSVTQKLICFEWIKIYRKGLFMQVTIIILVVIAFNFYNTMKETNKLKEDYLHKLEHLETEHDLLPFLKESLASYEQMKESNKTRNNMDVDWHISETRKSISVIEKEIRLAKLAYKAHQNHQWTPFHEYQLFINRLHNGEFETGIVNYSLQEKMMLDASIEEKKWLIKYNIKPIFTGEFIIPAFHYMDAESDFGIHWINTNKKEDSNGLYSLYSLFKQHYFFILIILLFFLVGGGIGTEKGKKSTIQFLLTQPYSFSSIYHTKWLTAISVSVISSIGFFVFIILLGTLFDRFGDWMYPILIYDPTSIAEASNYEGFYSQGMGFHFMPIGEYILQAILLYSLILVFLITLSHFCALFMNLFSVFTLVFILSLSGYFISTELLSKYAHLSPFTFLNAGKIINGEIAVALYNSSINFTTGIIVLIFSTMLILVIGTIYTLRTKK